MILFVLISSIVLGQVHLEHTSLLQVSSSNYDEFTGTITSNSDTYKVQCDCSDTGIVKIEEVSCNPTKIKLSEEQSGTGSSYKEVSEKLENYENYTYARVTRSSFRCLDGRISEGILGTPGGDAGEFLLGLLVYQDLTKSVLDQSTVNAYFNLYLKCMEMTRFYMCTDQAAIDHLIKELAVTDLDISSPDPSIQNDLLEALISPNNIGDTHFRLMMQYPDLYSIDKKVVELFITAFYTVLWDKQNPLHETLYLDVLQGPHKETAFLEIKVNDECLLELVAPLVSPKENQDDIMSLLVNHIDAAGIRRQQIAKFFTEKIGKNTIDFDCKKMESRLNHHGLLFLDVTGSYLSKDLPFFTATFV